MKTKPKTKFRLAKMTFGSSIALLALAIGCTGGSNSKNVNSAETKNYEPPVGIIKTETAEPIVEAKAAIAPVVIPQPTVTPTPAPTPIPTPLPTPVPTPTPAPQLSLNNYKPNTVLNGRLRSIGSDTLDDLMEEWEKSFQEFHPAIRFFHEGKGSSTALAGLLESRSDFGPLSRPLKTEEKETFTNRFGYEPLQIIVGIDALSIYVHPSNPIANQGISLEQLDSIFSESRKRGGTPITTWGQLGLTGSWANAPIRAYSRNSASGTYGFFKSKVLQEGDFRTTNTELPGSEALVEAVSNDPFGIGYSGAAYRKPTVNVVPVGDKTGDLVFQPEKEFAYNGQYPLARSLFLAINHKPGTPVNPLHQEFLGFVLSEQGQALVASEGFFSVTPEIAQSELAKLQ